MTTDFLSMFMKSKQQGGGGVSPNEDNPLGLAMPSIDGTQGGTTATKQPKGMNLSGIGSSVGGMIGGLANMNEESVSVVGPGASSMDLRSGDISAEQAEREAQTAGKNKAIGGTLSSVGSMVSKIPGIGTIAGGVLGLAGGLVSSGIFGKKKREKQRQEDKHDMLQEAGKMDNTAMDISKKAAIQSSFQAGGYTGDYIDMFYNGGATDSENSQYYKSSGVPTAQKMEAELETDVQKISVGGTHEQNPNGGVVISTKEDGTPNMAEAGEVVVDLPSGQFVFSNRIPYTK